MRLYSEIFLPKQSQSDLSCPTLVFLHGLLGNGRDWRHVIDELSHDYPCITLDLPGHGFSVEAIPTSFEQVTQAILETLAARNIERYILIGYSMGGRLAMHTVCQPLLTPNATLQTSQSSLLGALLGVVIEGGNPGIEPELQAARWNNDTHWARRFDSEPLPQVLADWYQQSVFSSLNYDQRQSLIVKRSHNSGSGVARMLLATSLAKQPQLTAILPQVTTPMLYICGKKDQKFCELATQLDLDYTIIEQAGHNVHVEAPHAFAAQIRTFIQSVS